MRGKQRDVLAVDGLVGADVEARVLNGSIVRGLLVEIGDRFIVIERATTHRRAFVALDHLAVLVDETPPGLALAGRRDAEAAMDDQEEEEA